MSRRAEDILGWCCAAWWLLICVGILSLPFVLHARGQEQHLHWHPPEHSTLHEKFYSVWRIPPHRNVSCCGRKDCYPTQIVLVGGSCKARRFPGSWDMTKTHLHEWVFFDCSLLEENQSAATQPMDSPDGRDHVCISDNSDTVFCAARGAGT